MSYPRAISEEEYLAFADYLAARVMAR